jgi:hypothetical protein
VSTERTVIVPVWGGGLLLMPEPEWCTGHRTDEPIHPGDFEHHGPDVEFAMDTPCGPAVLARVALGLSPLDSSGAHGPALPHMAVQLGDGDDWFRVDPAGLEDVADRLDDHVAAIVHRLRELAGELTALREQAAGTGEER